MLRFAVDDVLRLWWVVMRLCQDEDCDVRRAMTDVISNCGQRVFPVVPSGEPIMHDPF